MFMISNLLRVLVFFVFIGSCTSEKLNVTPVNSAQFFRDGYPEYAAQAIGLITEDKESSLNVFIELKLSSIIAKLNEKNKKTASILIEIMLEGKQIGSNGRVTQSYQVDLTNQLRDSPNGNYDFSEHYIVEPGPCRIVIQITDQNSAKVSTVVLHTDIPSLVSKIPSLSSLTFLVKDSKDHSIKPYLKNTITQNFDSIHVYSQFLKGNKTVESAIFSIERFEADSLPAKFLFEPNILTGQIAYKGIDFNSVQLISKKDVLKDTASKLMELNESFKMLGIGNYMAKLTINFQDTIPLVKEMLFTVRSNFFPELKTARELAEPLVYIMDEKPYAKMMQLSDPDSLKKEVDRFWLTSIGNTRIARQSLQLYYERVEYANRYFTTFKEGWKTDPGMIYILFGTPRATDQIFRDIVWAYGMYQNNQVYDPELTFLFVRVQSQLYELPYAHYVVRRSPNYYQSNYRMIDNWKSGINLTK